MIHLINLLKITTNPHHLAHPLAQEKPQKVDRGQRILGIALFALSFLSAGILPAFFLYRAYQKYTGGSLAADKANSLAEIHFNHPLFDAVEKGDLDQLKKEVAVQGRSVNAVNSDKYTLLHVAVEGVNAEIVQFLLDSGANPNRLDLAKCSPFHAAILHGTEAIAKIFIAHPAVDINLRYNPSSDATPLMLAIEQKRPFIVEEILKARKEAIDLNATNANDQNIYHIIALNTLNIEKYDDLLTPHLTPGQKGKLLLAPDYQGHHPHLCAYFLQRDRFGNNPTPENVLKAISILKP